MDCNGGDKKGTWFTLQPLPTGLILADFSALTINGQAPTAVVTYSPGAYMVQLSYPSVISDGDPWQVTGSSVFQDSAGNVIEE